MSSSPLERLPSELQRLILSYLDYQSLILLSSTNRHFHRCIDPQQMADPRDKVEFIMRAAKDFPQHRPQEKGAKHQPGNFECYLCFRVRLPEHFDVLQPHCAYFDPEGRLVVDQEPREGDRCFNLRRFCIDCGVKVGLHGSSECLTTKTHQSLWVCPCRQVWQKPDCLRCPDCNGTCPLRPKRKW